MRSKSLSDRSVFSGVTLGGSGGGQSVPLIVLTIVVLAMALVTVWSTVTGSRTGQSGAAIRNMKYLFKCTECGEVVSYTMDELQKKGGMSDPMMMMMMEERPLLECPKCGKKAMKLADTCPNCGEVFVREYDPQTQKMDDICPKCGRSYMELWQEKHPRKKRR